MVKKVTLKDIAAAAGLSPASVSMILNHRSINRFNKDTVERIFTLAQELGYKNSRGQSFSLVKPSDTLIFIICPSVFNPFYTTII
ncbi:MAG: LacI family DNA-binding transcriptional regulator, partial [Phascolarctobacterium sp.]|nr:LacI family DNA-binding transcriptional regulator [Phascolarctobacterium sp.]